MDARLRVAVVALVCVVAAQAPTSQPADAAAAAIDGGKLPPGYRDWRLISVVREEGDLDDIRAVLGNDIAIKAYREEKRPFPDGAIIARLAWATSRRRRTTRSLATRNRSWPGHR